MKVNFKNIILLIAIVALMIVGVSIFTGITQEKDEIKFGELYSLFEQNLVHHIEINEKNEVTGSHYILEEVNGVKNYKTNDKGERITEAFAIQLSYSFQIERVDELARAEIAEGNLSGDNYNIKAAKETPWYLTYLPYIIIILVFIGLWIFVIRSANNGGGAGGKMNSFAKSKAKMMSGDKNAVKFADVAGADEEKAELEEVVEFLRDPSKFMKLGARIPRGVLLVGPPGTGKTLLAKAVAGEAGVPFYSISGSDFVEMYVGVGASRVRDLFDTARKSNSAIIFIDEIDAVGRHRGAGLGGGHDEREQTLNQLLVEMDGFGTNSGVIVMAATNRPDILDPALLRPGRFDRKITVNYPDVNGREAILKVHCRNKPLEESVDFKKIAQITIGFTGAELANLMNEAALLAAKKNKALIGMEDIDESFMKLLLGPQKKTRARSEKDNKLVAYHEAGHAVASFYCENTDPVKHITIIPAGDAGGVTITRPTEDHFGYSKNQMLDIIVRSLGGRAAEEIIFKDITTGASSDIQHATRIARNMVTKYGMSEKLGTVLYGSEHSQDEVFLGRDFSSGQNYSEETAAVIDGEIRGIIGSCYDRCMSILTEHIDKLHFVANFLLKNEFMEEDQFIACMTAENPTVEEIEAIATERKRKSEEENKTKREENAKLDEIEKERERLAKEAVAINIAEGTIPDGSELRKTVTTDSEMGTSFTPADDDKSEVKAEKPETKPEDTDGTDGE